MITPEAQRKIWLGGLIAAVILGLLFLLWAVFLNRGTITITAQAPFILKIEGLRTETCNTETCSTAVAPGDYTITLQKPGYRDFTKSITVPFGKAYEETVKLEYIPIISTSTTPPAEIFLPPFTPTNAQREELNMTPTTQLFTDTAQKFVAYIIRSDTNFRQTVYLASIKDGKITNPKVVTSFLRDLQNFILAPNSAGDKLAAIDQAPGQAALYMIDIKANNRTSIGNYPSVRDIRWIPNSNDFLFQAREKSGAPEAIYLYRWDDGKTTKLDLNTSMDNIAIINKDRIVAVTSQKIAGDPQEGALVSLTPDTTETPAVVDYSLIANQARLITTLENGNLPSRVAMAYDQKTLYYQIGEKVFELHFEE